MVAQLVFLKSWRKKELCLFDKRAKSLIRKVFPDSLLPSLAVLSIRSLEAEHFGLVVS